MNLLLFKVSTLGENILFTPVVQELKRRFPDTHVTLFTGQDCGPLYAGPLAPTRIHAVDRTAFHSSWKNPIAFLRHWGHARAARADGCILGDDQGSVAHLLSVLTSLPPRISSADIRLRLPIKPTKAVNCPPGASIARLHWEMARALAAEFGRFDWPLVMPPPDLRHLISARPKTRPIIVIDAGARHDYKRWSLDHFNQLTHRLAADFDLVWVSSWSSPARHLPESTHIVPITDIADLSSWLSVADLFIGNHSDTLQLASALGCPGLVLSGPTHPEWDPIWHADQFQILRASGLPCLPCEKHRFVPGVCTYHADPQACLLHWTIDEIERRARQWITRGRSPAR